MKENKNEKEKENPLEEKKRKELEEKFNDVNSENIITEEKPKRGRKKKEIVDDTTINEQDLHMQGQFFVDLMNTLRYQIHQQIPPITDNHASVFITSYIAISKKYGDIASKYMPEIMIIGAIGMICYDTYMHIEKIKKITKEMRERENGTGTN